MAQLILLPKTEPSAGDFVGNCMRDIGMQYLCFTFYTNNRGHPSWHWEHLHRLPLFYEVDKVLKAFDLWYQRHPLHCAESYGFWEPYSAEKVIEAYNTIVEEHSARIRRCQERK